MIFVLVEYEFHISPISLCFFGMCSRNGLIRSCMRLPLKLWILAFLYKIVVSGWNSPAKHTTNVWQLQKFIRPLESCHVSMHRPLALHQINWYCLRSPLPCRSTAACKKMKALRCPMLAHEGIRARTGAPKHSFLGIRRQFWGNTAVSLCPDLLSLAFLFSTPLCFCNLYSIVQGC